MIFAHLYYLILPSIVKGPSKKGIGKETDAKNRASTKHRDKRENPHVGADTADVSSEAQASNTASDARVAYELRTQQRQKKITKKTPEEVLLGHSIKLIMSSFLEVRVPYRAAVVVLFFSNQLGKESSRLLDEYQAKQGQASYGEVQKSREELPVSTMKEEILKEITENQVMVISGEVGSVNCLLQPIPFWKTLDLSSYVTFFISIIMCTFFPRIVSLRLAAGRLLKFHNSFLSSI